MAQAFEVTRHAWNIKVYFASTSRLVLGKRKLANRIRLELPVRRGRGRQ